MPDPVDPRAFMTVYVEPAVELYLTNPSAKHLAVHALAQIDILASVVANYKLLGERRSLPIGEEKRFRDKLMQREPILQVIRDAHDAHKHGRLDTEARNFSDGLRPETETRSTSLGLGIGISWAIQSTFLVPQKGTKIQIDHLLTQALQAWKNEFTTLLPAE